ncbi:MAG: DUF1232 domain-containing protein [Planctomycetaceae bacterium]|nr:DUF1232 domain-containing protein [Planctomycetaceae bacterium]
MKILYTILGLLYVLSPIDALPDVIPILGWIDDIGVLGYLVTIWCSEDQPKIN